MLDDRSRFKNLQRSFGIDRHLPERLLKIIFGRPLALEQAGSIGQADLLERPTRSQVADQPRGERGHPGECADFNVGVGIDGHGQASDCSNADAPCSAALASIHIGSQWWPSGSSKLRPYISPPISC